MVEEEDWDFEPPPVPARPAAESGLLPGPGPDAPSAMTQALLDSGAQPVEGTIVPAYRTNEGTVFLGSPQDIARQGMMDSMASARYSRMRVLTAPEVDRILGEED